MAIRIFVNGVDSYVGSALAKAALASNSEFYPEGNGTVTVIGTLIDPSEKPPKGVSEIVNGSDKEALKTALLSCTHIVYDISETPDRIDDTLWACQTLSTASVDFAASKTFVCVSTVMTWAKTKPNEPDDSEAPIAEDEYRRRRPHMNFRAHIEAEKAVIKAGKAEDGKFVTYVVAAGLFYGDGELLFHRFFKEAWLLTPAALPCYGTGQNILPCIHIRDMASAVASVLVTAPQTRYILAVDEGNNTLEDMLKAIADTLGTGAIKKMPKEDALSQADISQGEFDCLQINLRLETVTIKDLNMQWIAMSGFVESIVATVAEYKTKRGLLPLKIAVFGPPASGKSHLARQLAAHYKLPLVHIDYIIKGTIERLQQSVADMETPEPSPEVVERGEIAREELAEARTNIETHAGRYSDELLSKWIREMLGRDACRNQGYVLDGVPKTMNMAKEVFGQAEEINMTIMPEHVFAIEASDDFLKERVMSLPECDVSGTHNTEEGLARRLARYRLDNGEDNTLLNYFDLIEIHPVYLTAENTPALYERAVQVIGAPHNYGPSAEESAAIAQAEAERKAAADLRAMEERSRMEVALAQETAKAQAAWETVRNDVQKQHSDARDTAAMPLRAYLVKNVLPTLSKALMDVCDVRPDDPIDFLAEYLFKHNPKLE